jgi:hypothetical protein
LAKVLSKHSEKLKALLIGLQKYIIVKMNYKMELLKKIHSYLGNKTKRNKIL